MRRRIKLLVFFGFLALGGHSLGADLLHRYDFSNDVADGVGTADGTLKGSASISGGSVDLNGSGAYVDLPNGLLSSLDSITVECWLTDLGSSTWARIFDFGNNTSVNMFLTPQASSGALRGAIKNGGSEQRMEWSGTRLPTGIPVHVVWTYDHASTTGKLYVDGELVAQNTGMTIAPSDMGYTVNNYIGRSNWSDPYFFGSIDEFRIYDGALTAAEVLKNHEWGPDVAATGPVGIVGQPDSQTVEESHSASFEIKYSGTPPVYVQWYRNSSPISGATNSSYTIAETTLADNGAMFHAVAANLYLGTPYLDTSSSATLTVLADTNAPVLVRAVSIFPDGVKVAFNEGVSPAMALDTGNYSISSPTGSLAITDAVFGEDTSSVILNTVQQTLGVTYTLHVSTVQDRSSSANTIAADSQATFVALPYVVDDIGSPGSASVLGGVDGGVDLTASGSGIGDAADEFGFSHKTYSGDFDIQVRLDGMEFSDAWARAGLMARDGLDVDDVFAAVFTTPGPVGCQFMSRSSTGGTSSMEGYFPTSFPCMWLRLRRTGNLFEGFAGIDGSSWQRLGSATIAMSGSIEVGLALASGETSTAITANYRDESTGSGAIASSLELPFEPLGPSSRRGAMVISEIMVDTPSEWGGTNSLEFVELYNTGLITEDLTRHRFSGEIDYTFPDGTTLAPGQFLVVAKDPVAAQAFYGVDCLGPYDGKLSNSGGLLRFRNELDGILLEVDYNDKAPWPVAAFGTGHSLVLSHPSYGEGDPRAWSASDRIGGAPGTFDGYSSEPARGVVINEYLAHTDLPQIDYVELFNTTAAPIDLSGAWLSDKAGTNKYRIADSTYIAARGFLAFDQNELGFALSADGEQIFLVNSNQTRVIDAVSFRGQENGVSEGRYPDGAPGFQAMASVTEGSANTVPLQRPVVINEIMYHPISDSKNDEYIELYNRTGSPVDLSGWKLQGGISYEFPSNSLIAGHGYLVVAENATNLIAKYTQLNSANTYGNYIGSLGNSSDTIRLSMWEDLISTNSQNVATTNIFYIPVEEVTYLDGGRWGEWSDGGGSSLELIDPDADNRQPASWADSDETAKAPWTTVDVTEILENGQAASVVDEGGSYGEAADCNRLELLLQGAGEVQVDDVEFLNNGGASLVQNGDFSSGSSSWGFGGVVRNSYVESGIGVSGSDALHLVSVARGDTGCNKAYNNLSAVPAITGSDTGTIRAKVRWLKGAKQILFRLRGNWMEASQGLEVPDNCGTPGQANSRLVANAGPAIYDVAHSPVLPAADEAVVVTARATDPDGISLLTLHYRIDPSASYSTTTMNDAGTGGDAVAGDGLYSATLAGHSDGTLVAFYISGSDGSASSQFPANAPAHECLVGWGESQLAGGLGTYRLWVTATNLSFWGSREKNANDPIDATFVYGNHRVVYNVGTMYSASPFHTPAYNGPVGSFACDYEVNFQPGERFLGSEPFVIQAEDDNGSFWYDSTTQVDLTGTWIARKLGQQYNYRRHMHMMVNGNERGSIYLDTQQPNSEMLDEYFPDDSQTELRKIESWFEFADNFVDQGSVYGRIGLVNKSTGGIDLKWYRWSWRPRATRDHENWFNFTNLVVAVNNSASPDWEDRVHDRMDVRNFLRPIVTHHVCGSWDSYAYDRGKNMYAFKPDGNGWRLLMWDIELALGNGSHGTTESIYWSQDSVLFNMITSISSIHREYLMAFQEAVDGPMAPGVAGAILNERYQNLLKNGVSVASPQSIINFISARRTYLQGILPSADFAVDGSPSFSVSSNSVVLTGTAPLQVADILVNGVGYPLDWTSVTAWSMTVPLLPGTNNLSIAGVDRFGDPVPGASAALTVISTEVITDPLDAIVINEWMADNDVTLADPADGDYEDWFELYNPGTTAVDLGGCYLTDELSNPFEFQIPDNGHYSIPPDGYLLVWADGEPEQNSTNQPALHTGFSLDKGGESIGLYAPDGREIDTVSFGVQTADLSEGRYPAGGDTILSLSSPTPGSSNAIPADGPVLGEVQASGTNVVFSWSSISGLNYQIYYKDHLLDASWIPLGTPIPGTGGTLGFTNSSAESPYRFYLLGTEP